MTASPATSTAQEWISHDPDPKTAAELSECSDEELEQLFAHPLTFGTAGLRGPLRGGPGGMNLAVVLRASWAVAKVLKDRGLAGQDVIVGRDARHGSDDFALAAAEVLAAQGFPVTLFFTAVPTPTLAFAVRHRPAAAGIQITASHNPPSDNGFKVFFGGGFPINSPTDREIEAAMAEAPHADEIPRQEVTPGGVDEVQRYVERAANVRHTHGAVRIAFTPLHGVGGEFALDAFVRAGLPDVHVVDEQFAPDPDFPTVSTANPEEPEAVEAVLRLAGDVDAEVAIALDPDADRCAVGVPTSDGWRMLSGDETGWLLGDYILSQIEPGPVMETTVVASTLVSSGMLSAIAREHGAQHVETPTGFKWLSRADVDLPGSTLVYAYEEAIGHCVDPPAVRDKDGISAAVLICDLIVALRDRGHTLLDALEDLARRHGVHTTTAVSRTVEDTHEAAEVMKRLRETPPESIAGYDVAVTDLLPEEGTDALVMSGGDDDVSVRIVVRPSGTEPKVKSYIEVRCSDVNDLAGAQERARRLQDELREVAARW